jgi:autonomous glycyl radical cofactor GrcA
MLRSDEEGEAEDGGADEDADVDEVTEFADGTSVEYAENGSSNDKDKGECVAAVEVLDKDARGDDVLNPSNDIRLSFLSCFANLLFNSATCNCKRSFSFRTFSSSKIFALA